MIVKIRDNALAFITNYIVSLMLSGPPVFFAVFHSRSASSFCEPFIVKNNPSSTVLPLPVVFPETSNDVYIEKENVWHLFIMS
jgi:hypothetical protein